nr:hypothetical protein CFP56_03790 [Quercus suber]
MPPPSDSHHYTTHLSPNCAFRAGLRMSNVTMVLELTYKNEFDWPPGTIPIELLRSSKKDAKIILQPRPSDDPNDPLVTIIQPYIQRGAWEH